MGTRLPSIAEEGIEYINLEDLGAASSGGAAAVTPATPAPTAVASTHATPTAVASTTPAPTASGSHPPAASVPNPLAAAASHPPPPSAVSGPAMSSAAGPPLSSAEMPPPLPPRIAAVRPSRPAPAPADSSSGARDTRWVRTVSVPGGDGGPRVQVKFEPLDPVPEHKRRSSKDRSKEKKSVILKKRSRVGMNTA